MSAPLAEYWFARRYPIGDVRGGMVPICWKGWVIVAVSFAIVLLGAGAFAWFVQDGDTTKGALTFAGFVFVGVLWFMQMSNKKGDHVNSARDYRGGKLSV